MSNHFGRSLTGKCFQLLPHLGANLGNEPSLLIRVWKIFHGLCGWGQRKLPYFPMCIGSYLLDTFKNCSLNWQVGFLVDLSQSNRYCSSVDDVVSPCNDGHFHNDSTFSYLFLPLTILVILRVFVCSPRRMVFLLRYSVVVLTIWPPAPASTWETLSLSPPCYVSWSSESLK